MKKLYIIPHIELINVEEDDLLTASGNTGEGFEVTGQGNYEPVHSGNQEIEDEEESGTNKGKEFSSWNFSAGEDW